MLRMDGCTHGQPENSVTSRTQFASGIIITCNPSIYTMDHLDLTLSNIKENYIGLKRDNVCTYYG